MASPGPEAREDSYVSTTNSPSRSKSGKSSSVFISYCDDSAPDEVEKVNKLRRLLVRGGKNVHEHSVSVVATFYMLCFVTNIYTPLSQGHLPDNSQLLPESLKSLVKSSIVLVICITKEYKASLECQKVARYCVGQEKRAIVIFAMLSGTVHNFLHSVLVRSVISYFIISWLYCIIIWLYFMIYLV
mgnify:CR=1 FL=1